MQDRFDLGLGNRAAAASALPAGEVAALDTLLDGAHLLGAELESTYRVAAITLEGSSPEWPWSAADRRLQVLCSPVSTILASLRRTGEGGPASLLTFPVEQLLDVVAALDGPAVRAPLFGRPAPAPGEWGPQFSMEGRSNAPDGTSRTLRIEVEHEDLLFGLFARFDDVELRDADGRVLRIPS